MKRIKKVHINNFKFFPESEPIKIDGKNILLYGENGSGKSSFYWALYTLLECSQKTDTSQIQKYFNKLNSESLVNIYAPTDAEGVDDSFIKIKLDDWLFRSISATLFGSNGATHFSLFRSSERSLAKLIILSVNV